MPLKSFSFPCFVFIGILILFQSGLRASAAEDLQLTVSFELNENVYDRTVYGEPPQLAVWLEQPETGTIRTLFVTYRVAAGNWRGKFECPVALPYWVSRFKPGAGKNGYPTPKSPLPDAISRATPQKQLTATALLPKGSKWSCFIEVNVSGDYNGFFPLYSDTGIPDTHGNGQPSIVYYSQIQAVPGKQSEPRLIGHTLQRRFTDSLVEDVGGITSAKKLLKEIRISVSKKLRK